MTSGVRWTARESRLLVFHWRAKTPVELERIIGRPWGGIIQRARFLRLRFGPPNGYISITTAARTYGMDIRTVERLARGDGLEFAMVPSKQIRKAPRRYLDADAFAETVATHRRGETVAEAARRLCVTPNYLAKLMRFAGKLPAVTRSKPHVRLSPSEFDRIAASQFTGETIAEGARRHGVDRVTMRNWLRRIGEFRAPPPGRRVVRYPRDVIDAAAKACLSGRCRCLLARVRRAAPIGASAAS